MANARMKGINAAYERAKEDICLRETRRAAAAKRVEEELKAAAKAASARQAEEQRKAASAARARAEATAARQEEEGRKAAAAAKARKAATEAAAENQADKNVPGRKMPTVRWPFTRSLGPSLACLAIILLGGYVIRALQTQQAPVPERKIANSPQPALLSAQPEQGNTGELEAKRIAALAAAEKKSAAERQTAEEKKRNKAVAETTVAIDKATAERRAAAEKAAAIGQDDGLTLSGGDKAIDPNQQEADTYIESGISNCREGNLEQAIIDLTEAIKINSHYARAYFNRGIVWTMLGEYDIAIHDFDRTIAIDPDYPRVLAHRDLAEQRKREAAIKSTNESKAVAPRTTK